MATAVGIWCSRGARAMVREAEMMKVPYVLTVGDNEVEARGVAVRKHGGGGKDTPLVPFDQFLDQLTRESAIPF